MRNKEKDAREMAERRENMLNTAFRLFTERNISSVTMAEIAKTAGYGNKTLHRYFNEKPVLVVAVATWKWEKFRESNSKRLPKERINSMTAAELFDFYLDSFVELYRNNKDLLCFNQLFNVYFRSEDINSDVMKPYRNFITYLENWFHELYLKAEKDNTLRTDVAEKAMFSATLHLMLAAITRYAVGLVYIPDGGFDAEAELIELKEMIREKYVA